MSKPKLIVQIGFPKTSTTTLQSNVLGALHCEGQINFLGNYYLTGVEDAEVTDKLLRKCIFQDGVAIDLHRRLAAGGAYLKGLLASDRVNVWSNENLTCPDVRPIDLTDCPRRIRQAFGEDVEYQIVITLREQVSLIKSYHANYFEERYFEDERTDTLNKYVDYIFGDDGRDVLETFDFSKAIKLWEDEFGAGNVHVNLFEDAKEDQAQFLAIWADLLDQKVDALQSLFAQKAGKRVRARVGAQYTSDIKLGRFLRKKYGLDHKPSAWPPSPRKVVWLFWKIVNRLFRRTLNHRKTKRVLLGEMSQENKTRIKAYYAQSNALVAGRFEPISDRMKAARYMS